MKCGELVMRKRRVIALLCAAWLLGVSVFLIGVPVQAQKGLPEHVYPAPEPSIVFEKNTTTEAEWSWSKTINIPFHLEPGYLKAYNVTVFFTFMMDIDQGDNLKGDMRIYYLFLCNGVQWRNITDIYVGGLTGKLGGYFPVKHIPTELLKAGENVATLKIYIKAKYESLDKCYVKLVIEDLCVKSHYLDLDRDGILDAADPLPGINNYAATILIGAIGSYATIRIGRKRR